MSFQTVLKSVGKDLSHVSQWIDDGLKVAAPIVGIVDPTLAPVFTLLEDVFGRSTNTNINASQLQQLVSSVATTQALKSTTTSTSSEIGLITLAERLNALLISTPSK